MRDFPSCFGENGVQVADFSSSNSSNKTAQNLVSCVYQCRIRGRSCSITVSWSKNLMGQGLSVGIDDNTSQCLCKVDVKPWLFSKKKGSKTLEANYSKIDIYWDLSSAKFGSGPEPSEGFYVGVVSNRQMILLLGDMRKEAFKKTGATLVPSNAVFIGKREHIFGKKIFGTKAQFCDNGQLHDLRIECDTSNANDPCLTIRIDSKTVMQVKRLQWKFRGNDSILVDGLAVEVFWDVHNWLFGAQVIQLMESIMTLSQVNLLRVAEGKYGSVRDLSVSPRRIERMFSGETPGKFGVSISLYAHHEMYFPVACVSIIVETCVFEHGLHGDFE
ncbi:hypothetical protein TEA_022167 [Camellia sinensis var. sinensis]|uniref:DUF868 domain-containing protein n=1 Tax=Camellia sinensis var. sinensis TaxID=542762 RepID=A0A4S4E2W8_CAMSN|nr:hypothetical protein TEA_022167 [Camellia sinensis var. sinensis]